jgi:hypothetical protein
MKPYTYLLKFKPDGRVYYGVRYSKDCDPSDLWVSYFSSCQKIWELIKEFGKDSFEFEIRKIFNSREAAIRWEEKVLHRLKAASSNKWINRNVSGAIFLTNEERLIHARKAGETKKKRFKEGSLVPWNKGKTLILTNDQLEKRRENGRKGKGKKKPKGFGEKISKIHLGKPKSLEHRNKLSETNKKMQMRQCQFCNKNMRANDYNLKYHENRCMLNPVNHKPCEVCGFPVKRKISRTCSYSCANKLT